jgi:hypothetical protein
MAKSKTSKKSSKKSAKKLPKKTAKPAVKKAPKKTAGKTAKKTAPKAEKKSTKRFLILYHVPAEAMAQIPNDTPEQREAGMALWKAWGKKVGSKMADFGTPLFNGKNLNSKGVTIPSTKEVAGYSLLDAADFEEVLELVSGNPHISGWHPEATIEIHEAMFIPGM